MSAVESSRLDRRRGKSKPTGWDRTRLGVFVPLCLVVAVAIVCIVVAALKSAQRADEIALQRERQLLTRAVANHGEWSLLRLTGVVRSDAFVSAADIDRLPDLVQRRLSIWFRPLLDHELALVFNSADRIIYSQNKYNRADSDLMNAARPKLQAIVDFLRGRRTALPDGAVHLAGDERAARAGALRPPRISRPSTSGSA